MTKTKKLTLAAVLVALCVVCSAFYIPVGIAKVFPAQAFINVLAGVLLGPWYAVAMAFTTSLIRVATGTGSLLAFPGSMCGALLSGLLYRRTNRLSLGFAGELAGTGGIGALLSYPIASLFLSQSITWFAYVVPFAASSAVGSLLSLFLLLALRKTGVLKKAGVLSA